MGTARNQKGKNKVGSWFCHRFTFDSDAFCVEMEKKAYAHRYDLGKVGPDVLMNKKKKRNRKLFQK